MPNHLSLVNNVYLCFYEYTSTKTDTNTINFVGMMYSGSEMVIRCQVARFIAYNPKRKVKNLIVLTYCHSNYKSCLALI